jgi:hypothetical protein
VSVINRLVDPGSELALVDWLPDSSLPELMGMEIAQAGKDRFYRISDRLLKHQPAIEEHLRQKESDLFELDRTLLLYDLTNSYFEGEAQANPKAKRGKSKKRKLPRLANRPARALSSNSPLSHQRRTPWCSAGVKAGSRRKPPFARQPRANTWKL